MVRSTSTGPSAGAFVRTCTWTFVMSGTASIGSCSALRTPTDGDDDDEREDEEAPLQAELDELLHRHALSLVAFGELAALERALQREGAARRRAGAPSASPDRTSKKPPARRPERHGLRPKRVRFVGRNEDDRADRRASRRHRPARRARARRAARPRARCCRRARCAAAHRRLRASRESAASASARRAQARRR